MKRDTILVCFGGAMTGAFGAGVLSVMEKLNIYSQIHSVYGVSAGAHNAAYFLTRQTALGSRIYFEDLAGDKFLKLNSPEAVWSFLLRPLDRDRSRQFVDVEYMAMVEAKRKPLKVERVKKSKIPFFIRLFNTRKKKEEYVEGRTNVLKKLASSAVLLPLYSRAKKVRHKLYADGGTISPVIDETILKMIEENPGKKFILQFNQPLREFGSLRFSFENFLWTVSLWLYFGDNFVWQKLDSFGDYRKLLALKQRPNVYIIEPDYALSKHCTDPKKLYRLYLHGTRKARAFFKREAPESLNAGLQKGFLS